MVGWSTGQRVGVGDRGRRASRLGAARSSSAPRPSARLGPDDHSALGRSGLRLTTAKYSRPRAARSTARHHAGYRRRDPEGQGHDGEGAAARARSVKELRKDIQVQRALDVIRRCASSSSSDRVESAGSGPAAVCRDARTKGDARPGASEPASSPFSSVGGGIAKQAVPVDIGSDRRRGGA